VIKVRPASRHAKKLYDLLTAAPLIAWYLLGLSQLLPALEKQVALAKVFIQTDYSVIPATLALGIACKVCTLIFLALLVVMFTVRRPPLCYASGLYPRLAAVAGTFLGVGIAMLPPRELSSALYLASLLLILSGTVLATWAVIALARSISILPEARRLVTTGPFTFVRHPLYLAEFVILFGVALQYTGPWAFLLLIAHCFFQFQRLGYEERVLLGAFPEYESYAARTSRLLPGLY
jgi:protein-S-isoprenylcysteine O-methyltransferase Ste14